jgi:hypothetical protein
VVEIVLDYYLGSQQYNLNIYNYKTRIDPLEQVDLELDMIDIEIEIEIEIERYRDIYLILTDLVVEKA